MAVFLFESIAEILFSNNTHIFTVFWSLHFKEDSTVGLCEERMVVTAPHIDPGMESCTTLTNNDVSCCNNFGAKALYTQTCRYRITAITGTTTGFCMCQLNILLTNYALMPLISSSV